MKLSLLMTIVQTVHRKLLNNYKEFMETSRSYADSLIELIRNQKIFMCDEVVVC